MGFNKEDRNSVLKKMNESLKHRGPDDDGIFVNDFVALGQTRLSIIDLSNAGHQPMQSTDGRFTIVFNGEIYNFEEVKQHLLKTGLRHQFKSKTDTEVLLYAYIHLHEKCLDLLNGMFAFCIYDSIENKIFAARDRMGIKPFYYFQDSNSFIFSSEIRSILLTGKKFNVSESALLDYFRYQTVHTPFTMLNEIKMLQPGNYISISLPDLKTNINSYWNFAGNRKINRKINYSEAKEQTKYLLQQSVKRRLVADVPFGAFLSGGIDSSAIVAIMSQVHSGKVETFSITFEEKEFSEEVYSNLISQKFNTNHHNIKLSLNEFLQTIPEALNAIDHPSADGINTYIVSKYTKNAGITMALSGLGGDEIFAGYDVFKRAFSLNKFIALNNVPLFLRKQMSSALQLFKKDVAAKKIGELLESSNISFELFYEISRKMLTENDLQSLANPIYNSKNFVYDLAEKSNHLFKQDELISKVSYLETQSYMQNVLLRDTDQMSMAVALEVRVPFLDVELVEFITGLSDEIKYPATPKKLLVESLGELLPAEIVFRPKMGFTLPYDTWLRKELKEFAMYHLNKISDRNFLNKKELNIIVEKFYAGDKTIKWNKLWYLVVLNYWLEKNNL